MLASLWALWMTITPLSPAQAPREVRLWEGKAPRETREAAEPRDQSKPNEGKVAGKPVIRLAPVVDPAVTVYLPPADKATGGAVVICPGG